jgi:hypothetical protein
VFVPTDDPPTGPELLVEGTEGLALAVAPGLESGGYAVPVTRTAHQGSAWLRRAADDPRPHPDQP